MTRASWVIRSIGSIAALGVASAAFTAWTARRVEAQVPPQGRFVDVDGARLHVVEKGEGPVIILLHGLGGALQHFTYSLFDHLSHEYRLVAIDRPGAGYSTRRGDEAAALGRQAQAISSFICQEGIESPLIVGHSLGGTLALKLALDHAECVGGLALLAPLTRKQQIPASFQPMATESATLRRVMAWTLATPMGLAMGETMLNRAFSPQRPPGDFAERGGGLLALRPSHSYTSSLDLVAVNHALPAMTQRYGELAMPVGVLYGTDDNLLDPDDNLFPLTSQLVQLDKEVVSGAGHMLPLTHPGRTAAFIRRMTAAISPLP
ncbi:MULTISPECIES: alpha/beta fold hydrolase [Halomonadaceae]|uniref:alpha/beta fold hydrolase n=1 Tax=Halomonadaceae TaxID=28256 RepID=UPI00159A88D8|nr:MULTISPECIES: alpha/beta hydrolase [Halomonas]QJQ94208.1 alpha/beta fold hydrolase [Halomonas sp. PA5]